jgi:CHAT domain-containing protein/Flp pilus assembly protein TadD
LIAVPRAAIRLLIPMSLALACGRAGAPPASPGVVVESASPQGAGARAGLRAGDILLSWRRQADASPLSSCADFVAAEVEQAPLGAVELQVLRGGKASRLALPPGDWQVEVLPRADGAGKEECRAYARARSLTREKRWDEARTAWDEAAQRARTSPDGPFAVRVLQEQGVFLTTREDFPAAEKVLGESLRTAQKIAPGSLAEASSWHALGRLEQGRGALAPSVEALRKALALRSRLAPGSLELVSTLNNLGIDTWYQRDLKGARALYLQALALARRRAPGSMDEARVLNNLGLLSRDAGEFLEAASFFKQAAHIWERLDPDGMDLTRAYENLAALASDKGDLAVSEDYHRAALHRFEAFAPESLEIAKILANLGMIARDRFDFPEAETLFRRALAVQQRRAPGSLDEAKTLSSLGWILQESGRLDEAEGAIRRALAIRSRNAPGSPEVALSLAALGGIAIKRHDYRTGISLGEQALAIQHRSAPGMLHESNILLFLGKLDLEQGRFGPAEARARQALAIRRRLAPRTRLEAEDLSLLARALQLSGRGTEAVPVFESAIDTLEAQIGRLGGTDEARSGFMAQFSEIYEDLIALHIQRGETAAALQVLERWRARMLLSEIAERDLAFSTDVPAPLLNRQRELDREYEKVQRDIAGTDPRRGEVQALLVRLTRLRNERSALVDRIVRASPRYASLRYPRPLDLAAARRALDPGTVWLSYFVTEGATFLFVVTPAADGPANSPADGIRAIRLAEGRRALEEDAAVFRGLILRGKGQTAADRELRLQGRKLYDLLIAPAEPWIRHASRILISPDGPLHTLPFAALVRPAGDYLVEWKPIHTVLSATLYAELQHGRRDLPPGQGAMVAFADPLLRAGKVPAAPADSEDPPLRRYQAGLPPLPGAREEVRTLAALYGRDASIYVGAAATEQRLEHLPVRPRYLHLACHTLLDPRFPLDSALALATPTGADADDGDDGMLQAWEILERLRFDADLVTLSACGTGLGREAAGEGMIGLTRAFQYAGARSVLASLWGISDRSTPELMGRFYTLLRRGVPKDVALAEAQREMLRGGKLSHPYSWAGFELTGDWK